MKDKHPSIEALAFVAPVCAAIVKDLTKMIIEPVLTGKIVVGDTMKYGRTITIKVAKLVDASDLIIRWHSISDRLPDVGTAVFVKTQDNAVYAAVYTGQWMRGDVSIEGVEFYMRQPDAERQGSE